MAEGLHFIYISRVFNPSLGHRWNVEVQIFEKWYEAYQQCVSLYPAWCLCRISWCLFKVTPSNPVQSCGKDWEHRGKMSCSDIKQLIRIHAAASQLWVFVQRDSSRGECAKIYHCVWCLVYSRSWELGGLIRFEEKVLVFLWWFLDLQHGLFI